MSSLLERTPVIGIIVQFFFYFLFYFFLRFVLYTIDFLRPAGGFLTLSSHFPDIMLCTPIDCTSSVLVITTKHKKENHYKLHTFKKQLDKMPLYKRNVLHSLFVCGLSCHRVSTSVRNIACRVIKAGWERRCQI